MTLIRSKICMLSSIILISFSTPVISSDRLVDKDVARDVIKAFLVLPRITDADRWLVDQWAFYAIHCADSSGLELIDELKDFHPSTHGSWSMPKNAAQSCSALRNGPNLSCYSFKATQTPFVLNLSGNRQYSYLKGDTDSPISTMIGAECQLVSGEPSTRQFIASEGKAEWLVLPKTTSFNTLSGVIPLHAGTMSLTIDGLPPQYVTVVVLEDDEDH